jgi:uncharacterized membrane protein YphA (DoxX/SURF4 family)
MKRNTVVEVISFLFILLFVYAAASKLMDYQKFRIQIGQSPLLTAFSGWVAWIIPAIELLVAVMLVIPRYRLPGLYASFSLMTMFSAYIIVILNFSDFVPCSCGGLLQKMTWGTHLVFNICFVFLGLTGIILESSKAFTSQEPRKWWPE